MQTPEELARRLRSRDFDYVWDGEDEYRVDCGFDMSDQDAFDEIRARDAEIRRECADRAVRKYEQWHGRTDRSDILHAAITGKEG